MLKDLEEDVGPIFGADIKITESELIYLRASIPLDPEEYICSTHQIQLGKGYRPSEMCKYFDHPLSSTAKGIKVSWNLYKFLKTLDADFILGSMVCKECQVKLYEVMKREPIECDDKDPDFVPPPFLEENDKLNRREQLDCLTTVLGVDRVRYLIGSDIKEMSDSSLNYFCHLYKEMQIKLTDKFCSLVAPGQRKKCIDCC